jgi:glutamate racemase
MTSIAVFDSGLGGLTVLKAIREMLPEENIVYFGDTARLPYGDKSSETVIRYSCEIGRFLLTQDIKMLVVACNTASAYAAEQLRQEFSIPVIDVINPLVEEIRQEGSSKHIAVLGTQATIRSGVYQKRIQEALPHVKVTSLACPLFVPLVEEHFQNHPAARLVIEEYLSPLRDAEIDTVVLGCTHYPMLEKPLREFFGADVNIVDSASACARKIMRERAACSLNLSLSDKAQLKYFVSDDPDKFKRFGEHFLGTIIGSVEKVIPGSQ